MAQNIFEELQAKKQHLADLAHKAKEYGWIEAQQEKDIVTKLDNDVLTIGVIGQMKCGKSTFLNSFVFEDDVLPAATTPMTAALSVITYGENKKVVAEFYTQDEWEEQKLQASRSLEEVQGNPLEESKVKAAQELMEKAGKLGSSVSSYLGKKQEDTFENLIEYVGADGKYISITKAVTIYYPKEYLKGVEIVDTPGFNDPIVSREERTKAFLKKADVVLLMLYAGRPFDATDREILFQNVRQCGIGKVIIGINKYDIPFENGETEEEIKQYVKEEIKKACKAGVDDSLTELLKEVEPIPLSAEMALLSELPMSKISQNEAFDHAWKRACSNFEISSQPQMREKSHLDDLTFAVKNMVETEKEKILFAKPLNAIMAAGNNTRVEIEKDLREQESMVVNLNKPDDELEEKQEKLSKAEKRLKKKIEGLGDDIELEFKDIIRTGKNEMEDAVDAACNKMDSIIESLGRLSGPETIQPKISSTIDVLVTRTLKRLTEGLSMKAKAKIKNVLRDFTTVAQEVLIRYAEDFDADDFVKSIDRKINLEIEDKELFSVGASGGDDDYGFGDFIFDIIDGASWGLGRKIGNFIGHNDMKKDFHNLVNDIRSQFDAEPYLETIMNNKDSIINMIKTCFIDETLTPMQQQIDEIRSNKLNKEQALAEAQQKVARLKTKLETVNKQLVEINGI